MKKLFLQNLMGCDTNGSEHLQQAKRLYETDIGHQEWENL